jgi:SAM-dependent methyltransferase
MSELPFSQACENNKLAIGEYLQRYFADVDYVLEVGSGTGQHGAYFSSLLPQLRWQPADRQPYLAGIRQWVSYCDRANLLDPLLLDVNQPWPIAQSPAIFSANTVHIMSWAEVEKFFASAGRVLDTGGVLCLYGPFNYGGHYSSDSNAGFDQLLKQRDPRSGIRDIEAIDALAHSAGLAQVSDQAMPANNRLLLWRKHD